MQNPAHSYTQVGCYTVTLTVTNANGADTAVREFYVWARSIPAPVADFTADKTTGLKPLTVAFADASTNAPTAWSWDFGDGGGSTAENPGHTYTHVGSFTVVLTASNDGGSDAATKTNYVQVCTFKDVPSTNWAWAQIEACVAAGIVQGYADGSYGPGDAVTRAQMAVFISRGWPAGRTTYPPLPLPPSSATCPLATGPSSTSNTPGPGISCKAMRMAPICPR